MQIGIDSFVETTLDPLHTLSKNQADRVRDLLEEIELADQLGLDVFGIGEHHRKEFVASAPAVLLATAATRTKQIRLTSAVTVLSSDDPVRVFQQFATLDLVSQGRAEIIVGRGSFIESYPLFGFDLNDAEPADPKSCRFRSWAPKPRDTSIQASRSRALVWDSHS